MRQGEDARPFRSQHRNRLVTHPSHWLLWQAADVQSTLTSRAAALRRADGVVKHLTASPQGMQVLQGYRHTVPLHPVLVCTLHLLTADARQRNAQKAKWPPKTSTHGPLMQPCYLSGLARQDTGSCFHKWPHWNSKCALIVGPHISLLPAENYLFSARWLPRSIFVERWHEEEKRGVGGQ